MTIKWSILYNVTDEEQLQVRDNDNNTGYRFQSSWRHCVDRIKEKMTLVRIEG
jgi:hypothetical protein